MTISTRALLLALVIGSTAVTAPASAQYYQSAPPPSVTPRASSPAAPAGQRKFDISNGARKAIVELQTAVNANDVANFPAKLAAAQAVGKTKDDKYVIGQLQLKAAVDQKDNVGIGNAIEAMLASGSASPAETSTLYLNLGRQLYNAKQYDRAATAFERLIALNSNDTDAIVMLAETRKSQNRAADAVTLLQRAIAARISAGQKPSEDWYKRAVAIAYDAKLPSAIPLSRDWVTAYPSPKNWRDTLLIYQTGTVLDETSKMDLYRLSRAAGALAGESDYYEYASRALSKGLSGEAKAVLEEGFAAKSIDRSKPIFRDVLASATTKSAGDRATLAGFEKTALAAPAAKSAMATAEAYFGYGDYAKAATLYRAALTKTGVDPSLANLRLGMALARSGDKIGATAALNAVTGPRADIAKYWLLWLATRA